MEKPNPDWIFKSYSLLLQLSNMMPAVAGPMILGSHVTTTSLWYSLALISTTISHCGYHLPFLPSPEFHDFHHLKSAVLQMRFSHFCFKWSVLDCCPYRPPPWSRFNNCFGVMGVLDRLHGTDSKFRETKQYERHVMLINFTPLNESIPDSPKKGQWRQVPSDLWRQNSKKWHLEWEPETLDCRPDFSLSSSDCPWFYC